MRYLNTKNIIAAGVLLACMSSIAWGAIIPDRTRIIMNESDKGEALKLTNQSKNLPYLAQTWIEDTKGNKSRHTVVDGDQTNTALPQNLHDLTDL